ncbi:MAG: hypothetical protein ABIJ11_02365 [Elusimicrobiota bacterium]
MKSSKHFNFYGVKVYLESDDSDIAELLARDFAYFVSDITVPDITENPALAPEPAPATPGAPATHETTASPTTPVPAIKIHSFLTTPDFSQIPAVRASLYNPDSISYDFENKRYVDYHGEALTIYDYKEETGRVYTQNSDLMHELVYLLILSRSGELLDKRGIHRLHAMGISFYGKGVLLVLPQGAGKTTLALELLKHNGVKLLADDTPLVSKKGEILPFPIRIGVRKGAPPDTLLDIPEKYLYNFSRRKHGHKILIDLEYFGDKISGRGASAASDRTEPAIILIGEREAADNPRITKICPTSAILPFITNGVLGLGLPQMVEYFLRTGIKDLFAKFRIAVSRLRVFLKVIAMSRCYRFTLGTDSASNARVMVDFLRKNMDGE